MAWISTASCSWSEFGAERRLARPWNSKQSCSEAHLHFRSFPHTHRWSIRLRLWLLGRQVTSDFHRCHPKVPHTCWGTFWKYLSWRWLTLGRRKEPWFWEFMINIEHTCQPFFTVWSRIDPWFWQLCERILHRLIGRIPLNDARSLGYFRY